MPSDILLMHNDATDPVGDDSWEPCLERLRIRGHFHGGSAIGPGVRVRKDGAVPAITGHLSA